MNLVSLIGPHLPYLRRYARALTGDQDTGDRYVRLTLGAIVAGDLRSDDAVPTKVALYHSFHALWASSGGQLEARADDPALESNVVADRLLRMTPLSRQAFLLTAVEGFSFDDVAIILEVPSIEVQRLIATAQRQIDADLATLVLIIEDEGVIAADLEAMVTELGHQVSEVATTRTEAVASVGRQRPGLVLADIKLADGSSGIDAVNDILAKIDVPVIFITAFPERLLTGKRPEPTFLITKPFLPSTVQAMISQALFFHPGLVDVDA